jgi:AraC-like DNA-binding protein
MVSSGDLRYDRSGLSHAMLKLHRPESFRLSTDGMSQPERLQAVRALRDRGVLPIEPLPDRAVHVDIATWFLPGLGILSGRLDGLRQVGTADTITDDLFFGINVAGYTSVVQRRREITPGHGDAFLLNVAAGAFAVSRPEHTTFVGLRAPRNAIAPLVRDSAEDTPRLIPRTSDSLTLLANYLGGLLKSRLLTAPEKARVVVPHVHDLIALTLGASEDATALAEERTIPAIRLRAIKSDIVANLEDERLTVGAVAARHRVTPRYVHRLFEREGITYTQFVLRQRLERAYRILRDPRFAAMSISSIAYEVGFGDLSYFNRAFRRQFQCTPSEVKNGGRLSSGVHVCR